MQNIFYVLIVYLFFIETIKCFSVSDGELHRYASYSASLVLIIFLCNPMFDFLFGIPDLIEKEQINNNIDDAIISIGYNELVFDEFDKLMKDNICRDSLYRFDIDISRDNVDVEYDDSDIENVHLVRINIDLRDGVYIGNVRELQEYLADIYLCSCEVIM